MPVPQKTFFLVEQASCLLQNLIKMNFARGLLNKTETRQQRVISFTIGQIHQPVFDQ